MNCLAPAAAPHTGWALPGERNVIRRMANRRATRRPCRRGRSSKLSVCDACPLKHICSIPQSPLRGERVFEVAPRCSQQTGCLCFPHGRCLKTDRDTPSRRCSMLLRQLLQLFSAPVRRPSQLGSACGRLALERLESRDTPTVTFNPIKTSPCRAAGSVRPAQRVRRTKPHLLRVEQQRGSAAVIPGLSSVCT